MVALRRACSALVGRPRFLGAAGAGGSLCMTVALLANHPSISDTRKRLSRIPNRMLGGAEPRYTIIRKASTDGNPRYADA